MPQKNISINECADSDVKRSYYREFYLTFPENYNVDQITNTLACQIDNKIRVRIENSLIYEENTCIYEIFIGTVFLIPGFVSLAILKSAVFSIAFNLSLDNPYDAPD